MYTIPPKKLLTVNILDILKQYSDEEHRLSQKNIIEILRRDYEMTVDRKAVKRNLMNLVDAGYRIEYTESVRTKANGEEEILYTDWYYRHDFSGSELRLLIDSLLFSKHIPYSQCKQLIGKLEGLSSRHFRSRVKHVRSLPDNKASNKQLFYTIDILDEAIERSRQVRFEYCAFDVDKKMHPRLNDEGTVRKYIVNPFQMVASNGRYYLICNYDKYDDISHYRVDRITAIELLETPAKPLKKVLGTSSELNLPKHIFEHVHMFAGESERVVFRAGREIIGDIIDWFGEEVLFSDVTEREVTATVTVSFDAMRHWAMQYARNITIISPPKLREQMNRDLCDAIEKYKL